MASVPIPYYYSAPDSPLSWSTLQAPIDNSTSPIESKSPEAILEDQGTTNIQTIESLDRKTDETTNQQTINGTRESEIENRHVLLHFKRINNRALWMDATILDKPDTGAGIKAFSGKKKFNVN